MSFFQTQDNFVLFHIKVYAKSSQNKIGDVSVDIKGRRYLKVYVHAPAQSGEANEAVLKLLSKALKVPSSSIIITHGSLTPFKVLKVPFTPDVEHIFLKWYSPQGSLF